MNTNITQENMGEAGKAKAQLEFRLAESIKGNKNFYHYISHTKMNMKNVGLWLEHRTAH